MRTMTVGVDSQPSSKKPKKERIPPTEAMVIKRGIFGDGIVRRKNKAG